MTRRVPLEQPGNGRPPGDGRGRRPAHRIHVALLVSGLAVLVWSGVDPRSRLTWISETFPAVIGGALLVGTYRRFRFSTATYVVTWVFGLILMVGGHWTYAEVPLGNWARDAFDLSRNHFDRLGHFFQGAVPALLLHELLMRTTALRSRAWAFFLCVCAALAVSAAYEIFEWWYAVLFGGEAADDFLGSQGDPWDAQKDMGMALLGAILALIALSPWQRRRPRSA